MSAHTESWPKPHRLTVDDYYRMAEVGVLSPNDRTELIEGEIIDMAPIGSVHAEVLRLLTKRLIETVRNAAHVSVQLPVRLSQRSEPQPDIAVLEARSDDYRRAHPSADDVLLLIEVSDKGPGVKPEDRDKVFEPFFTGKTQGTGLGLAITRRIVELHGGTIRVDDAPGGGARFRIEIPHGAHSGR